jgi:hypothetical protein
MRRGKGKDLDQRRCISTLEETRAKNAKPNGIFVSSSDDTVAESDPLDSQSQTGEDGYRATPFVERSDVTCGAVGRARSNRLANGAPWL